MAVVVVVVVVVVASVVDVFKVFEVVVAERVPLGEMSHTICRLRIFLVQPLV